MHIIRHGGSSNRWKTPTASRSPQSKKRYPNTSSRCLEIPLEIAWTEGNLSNGKSDKSLEYVGTVRGDGPANYFAWQGFDHDCPPLLMD